MKKYFVILTALFSANALISQHECASAKINNSNLQPVVAASFVDLENKYDVKFIHLDINAERINKNVAGKVRTKAIVNAPTLDTFAFELYSSLIIDSVRINGALVNPIRNQHQAKVVLPQILSQGALIDAVVYYRGTPPTINGGAIGDGFNNRSSPTWGNQITWSLSQPYSAYEWFPCKQQLQDKIDSVYIFVTTDSSNKVGSNGVLTNVVTLGNKKRYEWKEKHMIDYYLVSVAIGKYVDYSFYAHPVGSPDSVLVQNYVYDNPATLQNFKTAIDQTDEMIEYFSEKFGLYPFWDEKYGHAMAPFGGGMEHQTMSSMGSFNFSLIAHELGHQWFGDFVTCRTWNDIFINEGFASYCEQLAYEHFQPTQAAANMNSVHNSVMSQNGGSVYNPDTVSVSRIFDSRLSYDKGNAIIHSLRFVINNDSLFFLSLQNFMSTYGNSTASIDNLKSVCENTTGLNLTQFFNQWVYGEGYPTFTVRWNQSGNSFFLKNTETVSMPSITPLFITPLEYKLVRSIGDTIIRLNQNQAIENYSFSVNGTVTNVVTDPNNWILNKGTVAKDLTLSTQSVSTTFSNVVLVPNPVDDYFSLTELNLTYAELQIFDLTGRLIRVYTEKNQRTFDVRELQTGMYWVKVISGTSSVTVPLIKK